MGVVLTAFADEIGSDPQLQIDTLRSVDVRFLELRAVGGKGVLDLSENETLAFQNALDAAGIGVSSIGSPIGKVEVRSDLGAHFERFKIAVERAQFFGARYVRVFSFYHEGEEAVACRGEVVDFYHRMVEAAGSANVVLLHENESHIYGDVPTRCMDLLEAVANSTLRAAFDPANFIQVGVDPLLDAWPLIKEHTVYFHIKDALADSHAVVPAGYGDGGLEAILRDAVGLGFSGFLSLEPHLKAEDPVHGGDGPERFVKAVTALRQVLERIGVEEVHCVQD